VIRIHLFRCSLPRATADALNRESGRIYTEVLVAHYRVYRHSGHWLSWGAGEKINDRASDTFLQAHSRDAAQQGFYKACHTAWACRRSGLEERSPHRRKFFRTTIWKKTGIRKEREVLLLSLGRGHAPVVVGLPSNLSALPGESFLELRLVWERGSRRYEWHAVVEDRVEAKPSPSQKAAGVDLGEIHPAAVTDGEQGVVFAARTLHALSQDTHRRLSELQVRLAKKARGSLRYQRLMARKSRFLGKQKRRRDIEHKVSRAVVAWAVERGVGVLAVGDVRDAGDGVELGTQATQRISSWPHGKLRQYIQYKAEAEGIRTELVEESYTSQTCPRCGSRHKPRGRVYRCPACGFLGHRDGVGATVILSRHMAGEVGKLPGPTAPVKYRYPFWVMRSRLDTAQVARQKREAAGLMVFDKLNG
jgi:putative transposase